MDLRPSNEVPLVYLYWTFSPGLYFAVMKPCPECHSKTGIKKFLWGMPQFPVDETKYVIGGCCVTDDDPTHACIECGWEGRFRKKPKGLNLQT